jgi:hypothetical protein
MAACNSNASKEAPKATQTAFAKPVKAAEPEVPAGSRPAEVYDNVMCFADSKRPESVELWNTYWGDSRIEMASEKGCF